jgi:hypothetical protein
MDQGLGRRTHPLLRLEVAVQGTPRNLQDGDLWDRPEGALCGPSVRTVPVLFPRARLKESAPNSVSIFTAWGAGLSALAEYECDLIHARPRAAFPDVTVHQLLTHTHCRPYAVGPCPAAWCRIDLRARRRLRRLPRHQSHPSTIEAAPTTTSCCSTTQGSRDDT